MYKSSCVVPLRRLRYSRRGLGQLQFLQLRSRSPSKRGEHGLCRLPDDGRPGRHHHRWQSLRLQAEEVGRGLSLGEPV